MKFETIQNKLNAIRQLLGLKPRLTKAQKLIQKLAYYHNELEKWNISKYAAEVGSARKMQSQEYQSTRSQERCLRTENQKSQSQPTVFNTAQQIIQLKQRQQQLQMKLEKYPKDKRNLNRQLNLKRITLLLGTLNVTPTRSKCAK